MVITPGGGGGGADSDLMLPK
jgi:hypothetical protein